MIENKKKLADIMLESMNKVNEAVSTVKEYEKKISMVNDKLSEDIPPDAAQSLFKAIYRAKIKNPNVDHILLNDNHLEYNELFYEMIPVLESIGFKIEPLETNKKIVGWVVSNIQNISGKVALVGKESIDPAITIDNDESSKEDQGYDISSDEEIIYLFGQKMVNLDNYCRKAFNSMSELYLDIYKISNHFDIPEKIFDHIVKGIIDINSKKIDMPEKRYLYIEDIEDDITKMNMERTCSILGVSCVFTKSPCNDNLLCIISWEKDTFNKMVEG